MYTDEKMKELLYEADQAARDSDYAYLKKLEEIMKLLQSKEDIDNFAEYMEDMTQKEYAILGGFIDEIEYKYITRKFTRVLRKLLEKYQVNIPKKERDDEIENIMLRIFEAELKERGE